MEMQAAPSNSEITLQESSIGLAALARLFRTLNQQGVRYCHWKSNTRLEQSLQGRTDLDLLVDTQHQQVFLAALHQQNIKYVHPAPGRSYPGIENYLGFDQDSGRLFHLHVHYRLVLGEQHVKNYILPLEAHFLNTVQVRYGVKIPMPELELIVLSVRALLKYRDRDALKDIFSIRSPGLPAHIQKEIEWLLGQTSMQRVSQTLEEVGGILPADLVLDFLETFTRAPRAGYQLLRLRGGVRRALSEYQRQNRFAATGRYFLETWRRSIGSKDPARKRMTLQNGGLRIAFIGADGAGKSTVVKQISKWLSWRLNVRTYYMGSSQPSVITWTLKSVSKNAGRAHHVFQRLFGENNPFARLAGGLARSLAYLRFLSEARDRYRRFLASQRDAAIGMVVFYDRYPLEAARILNHSMDGPRIASMNDGQMGLVARKLSRVEEDIYRKISLPEHVFALHVSPNTSQARKPEHRRELIEAKSKALENIPRGDTHMTEIDAELPLEQVVLQIKSAVWRLLP